MTKLTQQGLQKLECELNSLKEKAALLVDRIEEVAQPDESGEDGLAVQLKEELEIVNSKIDQIEEALDCVEVIGKGGDCDCVDIGTRVTMKLTTGKVVFDIVHEMEADPTSNKISDKSPLGQALLGKKVNQKVDFMAPVGNLTYTIVSIAPIV